MPIVLSAKQQQLYRKMQQKMQKRANMQAEIDILERKQLFSQQTATHEMRQDANQRQSRRRPKGRQKGTAFSFTMGQRRQLDMLLERIQHINQEIDSLDNTMKQSIRDSENRKKRQEQTKREKRERKNKLAHQDGGSTKRKRNMYDIDSDEDEFFDRTLSRSTKKTGMHAAN